jgi:hypothetical protein
MKKRRNHEPPDVVSRLGWRYHHLGIPTTLPHPDEVHLKHLGLHVRGFDRSPFGIEWMRFDLDSQVHDLVRRLPHIAFEVENLEKALKGRTLLGPISSPSKGVRVAMISAEGFPIELIEFTRRHRKKQMKLKPSRGRLTLRSS